MFHKMQNLFGCLTMITCSTCRRLPLLGSTLTTSTVTTSTRLLPLRLPLRVLQPTRSFSSTRKRSSHSDTLSMLDRIQRLSSEQRSRLWQNRLELQALCSLQEKGWKVSVEWKESSSSSTGVAAAGIGVFATQDIAAGTVLRIGQTGRNLIQFTSVESIEAFCRSGSSNSSDSEYDDRLAYVKDYLWGFHTKHTDARGYYIGRPRVDSNDSMSDDGGDHQRFFGMWLPGNGLNHHPSPNTVYQCLPSTTFQQGSSVKSNDDDKQVNIALVALTDIQRGDELYDDYRRHGTAPSWLKAFALRHKVTLNFADCNDFVNKNGKMSKAPQ